MAMNEQPQRKEMPAAEEERKQLSKNFWLYEFDCKDGSPVPPELEDGLQKFVEKNLQPLRDFLDSRIFVTSGYRTISYNKAVGGVKNSYHLYDKEGKFAVDLMVQGVDPPIVKVILEGLINLGIVEEGGIGLYKNFVHYDNRGYRARW